VQITTSEKGKSKVTGVMSLMKGTACPPQVNESVYFSLERDEFDAAVMDSLAKFYQDQIKASPEFQKLSHKSPAIGRGNSFDDMEDDLPDDVAF